MAEIEEIRRNPPAMFSRIWSLLDNPPEIEKKRIKLTQLPDGDVDLAPHIPLLLLWKDKCNEKAAELAALKDRGGDGDESVVITPALSAANIISPVTKTPSKLFIRDTRKQKSSTWNSKSTIALEDEENEGELKETELEAVSRNIIGQFQSLMTDASEDVEKEIEFGTSTKDIRVNKPAKSSPIELPTILVNSDVEIEVDTTVEEVPVNKRAPNNLPANKKAPKKKYPTKRAPNKRVGSSRIQNIIMPAAVDQDSDSENDISVKKSDQKIGSASSAKTLTSGRKRKFLEDVESSFTPIDLASTKESIARLRKIKPADISNTPAQIPKNTVQRNPYFNSTASATGTRYVSPYGSARSYVSPYATSFPHSPTKMQVQSTRTPLPFGVPQFPNKQNKLPPMAIFSGDPNNGRPHFALLPEATQHMKIHMTRASQLPQPTRPQHGYYPRHGDPIYSKGMIIGIYNNPGEQELPQVGGQVNSYAQTPVSVCNRCFLDRNTSKVACDRDRPCSRCKSIGWDCWYYGDAQITTANGDDPDATDHES